MLPPSSLRLTPLSMWCAPVPSQELCETAEDRATLWAMPDGEAASSPADGDSAGAVPTADGAAEGAAHASAAATPATPTSPAPASPKARSPSGRGPRSMAQRMQRLEEEVARLRAAQEGATVGGGGEGSGVAHGGSEAAPAPPADAPIEAHPAGPSHTGGDVDDLVALFSQDGAAGMFAGEDPEEEADGRESKRKHGRGRGSGPVNGALMGVVKVCSRWEHPDYHPSPRTR